MGSYMLVFFFLVGVLDKFRIVEFEEVLNEDFLVVGLYFLYNCFFCFL